MSDNLWVPGNEKAKDIAIQVLRSQAEVAQADVEQLTRSIAYLIDEYCDGEVAIPTEVISRDRTRIPYQSDYDADNMMVVLKTKEAENHF